MGPGEFIPDDPLVKSHVCYRGNNKEEWFYVSTINRTCSTGYGTRFSETIAFEWDQKEKKIGKMIAQEGAYEDSLQNHFSFVKQLFLHGHIKDEGQEE